MSYNKRLFLGGTWRTRTRLKTKTRQGISKCKVRNNRAPKIILGACWGARAGSLAILRQASLKGGGAEQRGGDTKILERGASWVKGWVPWKMGGAGTLLQTTYPPMEHLSNDHEVCANQDENSHNLMHQNRASCCEFDGKSMEMRQHHDQNFPMEGNSLLNKY